jgi:hypothetical protein
MTRPVRVALLPAWCEQNKPRGNSPISLVCVAIGGIRQSYLGKRSSIGPSRIASRAEFPSPVACTHVSAFIATAYRAYMYASSLRHRRPMLPEFGSAFPFPFPFPFPFWLPFAVALPFTPCGGWDALRRWSVFIGNLLLHVLHTGTGWQKTGARVSARARGGAGERAHWRGRRSRRTRRRRRGGGRSSSRGGRPRAASARRARCGATATAGSSSAPHLRES